VRVSTGKYARWAHASLNRSVQTSAQYRSSDLAIQAEIFNGIDSGSIGRESNERGRSDEPPGIHDAEEYDARE
jgi:hypothetical protein